MLKALNPSPGVKKKKETQIFSRVRDWGHLCPKQPGYPGLQWAVRSSGSGSEGEKHCRSLCDPGDASRLTWIANKDLIFFQVRVFLVDSLAHNIVYTQTPVWVSNIRN